MDEKIVNESGVTLESATIGNAVVHCVPQPKTPSRADEIIKRLAEIDRLGDTPRARREALLGAVTWLEKLNAEAATLRAELEKLT